MAAFSAILLAVAKALANSVTKLLPTEPTVSNELFLCRRH